MTAIHRFVPIESRRAVAAEGRGVPWVFDPPPVLTIGVECVSLYGPAWAFREIESANLALERLWSMLYG